MLTPERPRRTTERLGGGLLLHGENPIGRPAVIFVGERTQGGGAVSRERRPVHERERARLMMRKLKALYAWYARNAQLMACVLRDAEYHEPTREIQALRAAPRMQAYREVLGAELNTKQRALLNLALSFFTWRTLVSQSGLKEATAVDAMLTAIISEK